MGKKKAEKLGNQEQSLKQKYLLRRQQKDHEKTEKNNAPTSTSIPTPTSTSTPTPTPTSTSISTPTFITPTTSLPTSTTTLEEAKKIIALSIPKSETKEKTTGFKRPSIKRAKETRDEEPEKRQKFDGGKNTATEDAHSSLPIRHHKNRTYIRPSKKEKS